ncbi:oxygenase MpaB family protein [Dactylosporangium sp. CS-047395]|uniref:oxygenase MpaB family protein n=1 Tax=Dactylosporangium sp. CS-047395 TaxID=3239936 RepID=UPI003D92317F
MRPTYAETVRRLMFYDFPWDVRMAGRLMIWHLYAWPSTATVVGSTSSLFTRSEITSLTFGDLVEHGLDSPRGREILRFVNRSHRGTPVTAEHNRFALVALPVTLIRWLDRFGHRALTADEHTALFTFYAELGRRMGVRDFPADPFAYLAAHESKFAFSEAGRLCSERTLTMARDRVPRWSRAIVSPVIATLLMPSVREAVGLPAPAWLSRALVAAVLQVRRQVVGWLPPRTTPTTPRTRRMKLRSAEPQSAI